MPLYDQKRREDSSMTPQFSQKPWKAEHRWQGPRLPFILAAVSLIATVDPARLAVATECQVIEAGGTSQGLTNWEDTTLRSLQLTHTVDRDLYRGLVPSPVREIGPYMKRSRMSLDKTEDQEIVTIGACLSQDIRESALFKQAMITSLGKAQAKAHTPVMKFSALLYNGKKQVSMIRTTRPEIGVSAPYKTATIIGPVQEIQKPILSDERSVSQVVAMLPTTVESPSLFGAQAFVALNPLLSALQLPDNESLRMNLTTTRALHDGNCASGCP
jgi:hypothetical protein